MSTMQLAVISVRGVVQGVGFRPYIYSLANQYGLKGWVSNTSEGVKIQVEGSPHAIDPFCHDLPIKAPPAAHIELISITYQQPRGYNTFEIRSSITSTEGYGLVSPDLATCARCKAEIFDQSDRRYGYAFTNCTDCGPRFTIIRDMPYDRHCTTMHSFKMCPQCQAEYDDALQRRFHAQPNACPVCGPRLELCHTNGEKMQTQDVIWSAATLLREGKILAV